MALTTTFFHLSILHVVYEPPNRRRVLFLQLLSQLIKLRSSITRPGRRCGIMDTTENSTSGYNIKTRFIIISDTHGEEFKPEAKPLKHADVAIHCGDLTDQSKIEEYRATIRLLKDIDASLKLVIAGNHDFTMDNPVFKRKIAEVRPPLDPDVVRREYGDYGEVRQLFEEAKAAGIMFLDEGTYHFTLENGALLTVYASPWTPSLGGWDFSITQRKGTNSLLRRELTS